MMSSVRSAHAILESIWYKDYSIVSPDNRWLSDYLCSQFNFECHEYSSGAELNHWKVPQEIVITKALIKDSNGKVLFDGKGVPLALPPLCPQVNVQLSRQELKKKLVTVPDIQDARFYAWWNLYRSSPDWSFSVTHNEYNDILAADEHFHVEIDSQTTDSSMLVNMRLHSGSSKDTVIITAHTCHPFQANDDMSGVAVALWLSELLSQRNTKFSYLILLAPELLGPMFWLNDLSIEKRDSLIGCVQLKSVANNHEMRLQQSFSGETYLDFFAKQVLPIKNTHTVRKYRECYGNDETVFEAIPYRIPSITFTRMPTDDGIPPFDGYHSSADNMENIDCDKLAASCDLLLHLVDQIEEAHYPKLKCAGLPRLGDLGLYCPLPPEALETGIDYGSIEMRKHVFMNCVSNLANGRVSTAQMSERYNLPHEYVLSYLKKWEQAGLLEFV